MRLLRKSFFVTDGQTILRAMIKIDSLGSFFFLKSLSIYEIKVIYSYISSFFTDSFSLALYKIDDGDQYQDIWLKKKYICVTFIFMDVNH